MNKAERRQVFEALKRVPAWEWSQYLGENPDLHQAIAAARQLVPRIGPPTKPAEEVLDLLGHGVVQDWRIRRLLLRSLPKRRWRRLFRYFRELRPVSADWLHGRMVQDREGSRVMAQYWRQGGQWAQEFCIQCELPEVLGQSAPASLPEDEWLEPSVPLPPLHDFQRDVHRKVRRLLERGRAEVAVLSLPTGAGKTRVAVDAILDHLSEAGPDSPRDLVVWLAQSDELLRQAWACFRQAWTAPATGPRRQGTLQLVRAWASRSADSVEIGPGRAVVVAGVQQLAKWDRLPWPRGRVACVVVDELHRMLAPQHRDVLVKLGVRRARRWKVARDAPPTLGLTATPWRSSDEESRTLRQFFRGQLLTPRGLRRKPIRTLQERRILAKVRWETLPIDGSPQMTAAQWAQFEQMREVPLDYLRTLGLHRERNERILERLLRLSRRSACLVFACSLDHCDILTLALRRRGRSVARVSGETPRHERVELIDAFRRGELQFLCNVNVLTTGFDAPRVDAVCITRPTTSALLYEQMVGRGIRGPQNGGTKRCLVLDVQDEGLPEGIMSYERVRSLWDASRRRALRGRS